MAAAAASDNHVVDIIPDMDGITMFTEKQSKHIGHCFSKALFQSDDFAKLKFESSGFERGKHRIICTNEYTRDWVIATTPKLEGLGHDLKIKANTSGPPPALVRANVNISLPSMDPEDFFNIIGLQNPSIDTANWKLFNRNKAVGNKQLWIIGVEESTIQALRDVGCRPYCGMTRVKINLPNQQ